MAGRLPRPAAAALAPPPSSATSGGPSTRTKNVHYALAPELHLGRGLGVLGANAVDRRGKAVALLRDFHRPREDPPTDRQEARRTRTILLCRVGRRGGTKGGGPPQPTPREMRFVSAQAPEASSPTRRRAPARRPALSPASSPTTPPAGRRGGRREEPHPLRRDDMARRHVVVGPALSSGGRPLREGRAAVPPGLPRPGPRPPTPAPPATAVPSSRRRLADDGSGADAPATGGRGRSGANLGRARRFSESTLQRAARRTQPRQKDRYFFATPWAASRPPPRGNAGYPSNTGTSRRPSGPPAALPPTLPPTVPPTVPTSVCLGSAPSPPPPLHAPWRTLAMSARSARLPAREDVAARRFLCGPACAGRSARRPTPRSRPC